MWAAINNQFLVITSRFILRKRNKQGKKKLQLGAFFRPARSAPTGAWSSGRGPALRVAPNLCRCCSSVQTLAQVQCTPTQCTYAREPSAPRWTCTQRAANPRSVPPAPAALPPCRQHWPSRGSPVSDQLSAYPAPFPGRGVRDAGVRSGHQKVRRWRGGRGRGRSLLPLFGAGEMTLVGVEPVPWCRRRQGEGGLGRKVPLQPPSLQGELRLCSAFLLSRFEAAAHPRPALANFRRGLWCLDGRPRSGTGGRGAGQGCGASCGFRPRLRQASPWGRPEGRWRGRGRHSPSFLVSLGRMRSSPSLRCTQQVGMPGAGRGGGGTVVEAWAGVFRRGLFFVAFSGKVRRVKGRRSESSQIPLQLFVCVLPVSTQEGFVSQLGRLLLLFHSCFF